MSCARQTLLSINHRRVNVARIDQVLFPDAEHATVWHNGNPDPSHCLPDEVDAVRRWVAEAMFR